MAPDGVKAGESTELDFDDLPGLVGYHLRRAQVAVFNDFVGSMGEVQITPGQYGVMTLIGANPGLSQSALARAVGIERSTIVAVIGGLEARKLVQRKLSPVDKRSYALVLTNEGSKLLAKLKGMVRSHEQKVLSGLSDAERSQLIDLLSRLAD
jgi:DNA-binding MarR family transcriptional regulator